MDEMEYVKELAIWFLFWLVMALGVAMVAVLAAAGIWRRPLPQGVGYWWSEDEYPMLPHPRHLVEPGWRQQERDMILAYLRAGHPYAYWPGYSWCRFACGIAEEKMGDKDFTDGEWTWPEGLAHYVECHAVRLPEPFVETMRRNEWKVPSSGAPREPRHPLMEMAFKGHVEPWMELTDWLAWCREEKLPLEPRKKRWWQFWK